VESGRNRVRSRSPKCRAPEGEALRCARRREIGHGGLRQRRGGMGRRLRRASQPCLRLPITAPCSRRDLDHEGRTLPGALAGVVDRAVGAGGVDGEAVVGRPHGENSQKSRERTEGSPQFHWKGEGWDSTPGFRRARSFGGAGYERPAGCNDEGGMRPGGGMEERSAGRPLLHHGSGAYGTTWSTRAGFCPVPSREL